MRNILKDWEQFAGLLRDKPVFLFLDYDGTLTPIVKDPPEAHLSGETRDILDQLSRNPRFRIAIVSGRAIDDVKTRVGLKKLIYVGNHGFEISGPGIHFENHYFPKARQIYNHVLTDLSQSFRSMPQVFVEDKRITLSLHVRALDRDQKALFKTVLYRILKRHIILKEICLREGKEVFELRPPADWDKGRAVLWLLKSCHDRDTFSLYIGDDETDEDAFKVLTNKALTIHVGGDVPTAAEYYLDNTDEVAQFLSRLLLSSTPESKSSKAVKLHLNKKTVQSADCHDPELSDSSIASELQMEAKLHVNDPLSKRNA